MNIHAAEAGMCRNAGSIVAGASIETGPMDHHYGRRVERDGSWSIYHVFTGVPAVVEGRRLTGLSRVCATEGMLSMNRGNEHRRRVSGGR